MLAFHAIAYSARTTGQEPAGMVPKAGMLAVQSHLCYGGVDGRCAIPGGGTMSQWLRLVLCRWAMWSKAKEVSGIAHRPVHHLSFGPRYVVSRMKGSFVRGGKCPRGLLPLLRSGMTGSKLPIPGREGLAEFLLDFMPPLGCNAIEGARTLPRSLDGVVWRRYSPVARTQGLPCAAKLASAKSLERVRKAGARSNEAKGKQARLKMRPHEKPSRLGFPAWGPPLGR